MKNIAIVGCTGAVGKEIIEVLFDRNFPVENIDLFASPRSAGKTQATPYGDKVIKEYNAEEVSTYDIVMLAVSGDFAKAERAALIAGQAIVIDQSSAFRMDQSTPLIVPEVNPEALGNAQFIANPNCTTAIAAVALWPLHRAFGIKKAIVSTYQATSGGGQEAMDELTEQSRKYLEGNEVTCRKFAHPIPFNLIPHIDAFQGNAYTKEEMKVAWETQKIFNAPEIAISCTAVRIPTFRSHCESITLETEKAITPQAARELLSTAAGVDVVDDTANNQYPMPLTSTKKYNVEVGRIRQSIVFGDHGLDLFVSGDQILKGAALNAVQITELLI